ncbi:2-oxo acid dehydrogenase subunit E2, partial [Staphylococcus epidermidis]|uniref:2-oxo acid dehydrogenase subunit E2 n=1 Tax=Staphylococcus epidermidis TaxID=1282 RepID=UPI0037D9AB74
MLKLGERGIVGVGVLSKEVVVEGDKIKEVSKIALSLRFDHEILDGVGGGDFVKVVGKYMEKGYLLM